MDTLETFWIVPTQLICLAAAISIVAMLYDMGEETPDPVRWILNALSIIFFGLFLCGFKSPVFYRNASTIAFAVLGVFVIVCVGYLILKKRIQPIVAKVAGGALVLSIVIWAAFNFSDIKRQKVQIQNANTTSGSVQVGDTTKTAITNFNSLTR